MFKESEPTYHNNERINSIVKEIREKLAQLDVATESNIKFDYRQKLFALLDQLLPLMQTDAESNSPEVDKFLKFQNLINPYLTVTEKDSLSTLYAQRVGQIISLDRLNKHVKTTLNNLPVNP